MNAIPENVQNPSSWPELFELISLSDAAERIGVEPGLLEHLGTEGLLCPCSPPGAEECFFYLADLFALINESERNGCALKQCLPYDLYLRDYLKDDAAPIRTLQHGDTGDVDITTTRNNENFLNLDSAHATLSDVRSNNTENEHERRKRN